MQDVFLIQEFNVQNYISIFTYSNGMYIKLLIKTILMAGAITIGSVGLGYPVAYYISMRIEKHKYSALFLLMGPYLVNYILVLFAWRIILESGGILNFVLTSIGLPRQEWFLWNWWTVVFMDIAAWAPWLVFPMFASLEKMEKTLLEAAADLGANPRQAFLKVTLPLSMPGVLVATLFVLIPSMGEFATADFVGGSGGIVYAVPIENYFHKALQWPLGSAMSFFLLLVVLIMVSILLRKVSLEQIMESL
jgi:spermidine/putrescine transport system permease protein